MNSSRKILFCLITVYLVLVTKLVHATDVRWYMFSMFANVLKMHTVNLDQIPCENKQDDICSVLVISSFGDSRRRGQHVERPLMVALHQKESLIDT